MGGGNEVKCMECRQNSAKVRCKECAYAICTECAKKLGGGAFSYPTCPRCESSDWKAP